MYIYIYIYIYTFNYLNMKTFTKMNLRYITQSKLSLGLISLDYPLKRPR